ncbi:MAG: hypothetical protein HYT93_00645 [Parcubacteria group bacterium]|nr:hypothetical protein [Parcubacteria group bacterium]
MHTRDTSRFTFHFNSDFSGNIVCINKETGAEMQIPAEEILQLVAYHYLAAKKIEKLEQASIEELLLA